MNSSLTMLDSTPLIERFMERHPERSRRVTCEALLMNCLVMQAFQLYTERDTIAQGRPQGEMLQ